MSGDRGGDLRVGGGGHHDRSPQELQVHCPQEDLHLRCEAQDQEGDRHPLHGAEDPEHSR
eukprot:11760347-Heterocapsa_arctica.AAC.1